MKNQKIAQYVEDIISAQCEESGLIREEVTEVTLLNCIELFYRDELSKEDLVECAKYLEYEIDLDAIEKEKGVRQKRKAQRKARALKKAQQKGEK